MPTWSVRIHFTEPTFAAHRREPPTPYSWTWTGPAPSGRVAMQLAEQSFKALFALSGVGWVREIASIDAQQVQSELPGNEPAMAELTRDARIVAHAPDLSTTHLPARAWSDARHDDLGLVHRALRAAVLEQPNPGLFVYVTEAAHGAVARLWLAATDRPRAGVIGRHAESDLQLGFSDELSLRHVLFVTRLREGRARFTVLDLDTPNGLTTAHDVPLHLLEADEPVSFRTGPYSFFCVPTGPGRGWPEDLDVAWASFDAPPLRREATTHHFRLLRARERRAAGLATLTRAGSTDTWPVGAAALLRGVLAGRAPRCVLRVDHDDSVSRVHAVLLTLDGAPHVIDACSTNGTWQGQREVRCQRLHDGDTFRLGGATLRWSSAQ